MGRTKLFGKRKKRYFRASSSSSSQAGPSEGPSAREKPIPVETASSKKLAISSLACPSVSDSLEDAGSQSQLHSSCVESPSPDPGELLDSGGKEVDSGEDSDMDESPESSDSPDSDDDPDSGCEGRGHRIFRLEKLSQTIQDHCVCAECHSPVIVKEDLTSRSGIVTKTVMSCTNTACKNSGVLSDPRNPELNIRSSLAMRSIGKGRSGLESFCGWMDMPPPLSSGCFNSRNRTISKAATEAASSNMLDASRYLHQKHGLEPDQVLDIPVTVDGTWSKRGATATYGVVVVIAWETGQVLDYEIQSKRCNLCTRKQHKLGKDTDEFREWYETHKDKCQLNHLGSSPAMEMEAAVKLFQRSESHLHLRYTKVICDGDSKTITRLNEVKPYGEDVTIQKHECVGHVQKRMGKRLDAVKKVYLADRTAAKSRVAKLKVELNELKAKAQEKSQGKQKGKGHASGRGKGKGPAVSPDLAALEEQVAQLNARLTQAEGEVTKGTIGTKDIQKLQDYYGSAIRANAGNLEGMEKACWAVYYHSISTDENPQHDYCPVGEDSTCPYQRWAVSRQGDPPAATKRIPEDLARYVKPIFDSLCHRSLLVRCVLGATQNQNECFNAMIWARAPKTEFATLATIQFAVSNSVVVFNSGSEALKPFLSGLGVQPGPFCISYLKMKDHIRLTRAQYRDSIQAKKRRKLKRMVEKVVEASHIEEEGTTYGAGEF